jgi:hypothetical protein
METSEGGEASQLLSKPLQLKGSRETWSLYMGRQTSRDVCVAPYLAACGQTIQDWRRAHSQPPVSGHEITILRLSSTDAKFSTKSFIFHI